MNQQAVTGSSQTRSEAKNSSQPKVVRVRRREDGLFLTRDGQWDAADLAWTTEHPPEAAERAFQAQEAAAHAFLADVVPA
jgi:hypothetical protein